MPLLLCLAGVFAIVMRCLLAAACLLPLLCEAGELVALATPTPTPLPSSAPALPALPLGQAIDKVLVVKSEHRLQLMSRGRVVRSYRISLGKQPRGAKAREGDNRTPEGLYWIDWRKVSDKYNLAMHISYPNTHDLARARQTGQPPGGMIMLHGTPVDDQYPEWYFNTLDWTAGCIALRNADMREIWTLVKDGTLIEIRP